MAHVTTKRCEACGTHTRHTNGVCNNNHKPELAVKLPLDFLETKSSSGKVVALRWLRENADTAPRLQYATEEQFECYEAGRLKAGGIQLVWQDVPCVTLTP